MTWTDNLQAEILEQFVDVRWLNINLMPAQLEAVGLVSISDNDNYQVVARKADDDLTMKVRDAATARLTWRARDLAKSLGFGTKSGEVAIGKVLARTEGWVQVGRMWVNRPAVLAWCAKQPEFRLLEAARTVGVHSHRVAKWLQEAGWKPRRFKHLGLSVTTWAAPKVEAV